MYTEQSVSLSDFPILRSSCQIIQRYLIIIRELHQMLKRNGLKSPLVAGIHGLPDAEHRRDVFLREIGVLPQILDSLKIHDPTSAPLMSLTLWHGVCYDDLI